MQEGQFQLRGGAERRPESLGALGITSARYRIVLSGEHARQAVYPEARMPDGASRRAQQRHKMWR
jgi:hypothetical protein